MIFISFPCLSSREAHAAEVVRKELGFDELQELSHVAHAEIREDFLVGCLLLDALLELVQLFLARCTAEDQQRSGTLPIAERNIRFHSR